MSIEARDANWASNHRLRKELQALPENKRPSYLVAAFVSAYLADKHVSNRGYVDSSVRQIAVALDIPEGTVRRALSALDSIGWWEKQSNGNRYMSAQRVPRFIITEDDFVEPF